MKSKLSLLIFLILVFSQCNQGDTENVATDITIPLLDKSYEEIDLVLSDFISDIEYIPLETREECLVDQGASILDCDDFFLVGEGHQDLMMFDKKGKFLGVFAHRGEGPGEYRIFVSLFYDKENQTIILNDTMSKKLWFYNKSGGFIKGIDLPAMVFDLYRLNNGSFLGESPTAVPSDSGNFSQFVMDSTGSFTPLDLQKGDEKVREVFMAPSFIGLDDRTAYLSSLSYKMKIFTGDDVTQTIFFDPGEASLPMNLLSNTNKFRKNEDEYLCYLFIYPGFDQKIFLSYYYHKKPHLGLLDMNDHSLQMINLTKEDRIITNDIDCGPDFKMGALKSQDYWYKLMWIQDLQQQADVDHTLIQALNKEDNPVIVVYKEARSKE